MKLSKFAELKDKVERLQNEEAKAAGGIEELKRQLQEDFDCDSVADAEKLMQKEQEELREDELAFEERLENFEKEYESRTTERTSEDDQ